LITGASSGIGAELARGLCARGHDVILIARRRERLDQLATDLRKSYGRRVEVLTCDVSDAAARDALPSAVGDLGLQVDVLVLSAGFGIGGPFIGAERDRVVEMVRTNLEAVMVTTWDFAVGMAARRSGAILLVSSMAGNQPMPNFGAYAATKAGVTSFGQALAGELGDQGVTVTTLCPGGVRTEFAGIASLSASEERMPNSLLIDATECADAGLTALEAGRLTVTPRAAVRAVAFVGAHAPRRMWLGLCRRGLARLETGHDQPPATP
jgi:short-subunit dehydrogenase